MICIIIKTNNQSTQGISMSADKESFDISLEPKISISNAAKFLGISMQAVHNKLKAKNLECPKLGNKMFLTHSIARKLFELPFQKKNVTCQIVKGGVGKTTSIQNIAACASTYGARVLLIDIDPQGNLTDAYNIDPEETPVLIDFLKDEATLKQAITPVSEGIDLVPSRIENVVTDNQLISSKRAVDKVFRQLVKPVRDDYDFVFIDCAPTICYTVTAAALFADVVLAPLNPDKFSAKGLKILKEEISLINERFETNVDYKVFLNKFSGNTILSDKAIATILSDKSLNDHALQSVVRFAQEIPNVTDASRNMFSSLKKSQVRDDFNTLTCELLGIKPPEKKSKKQNKKAVEYA